MRDFNQDFVIDTDETQYSEVFELVDEAYEQVDINYTVSDFVAGQVVVTPQRSMDKVNWEDLSDTQTLTANGLTADVVTQATGYLRFKLVSSGSADLGLAIHAIPGSGDTTTETSVSAHTQARSRTSVSASTATTIADANTARKEGRIVVESTNTVGQKVYVKFGSSASATSYDEILEAGDSLELDLDSEGNPYNGVITVFSTDTAVVNFSQR